MMSAAFSSGRCTACIVGLLLAGVVAAGAQPEPGLSRARAALLYGPSGSQGTVDTTTDSGRHLEAALHLGGGVLASSGAVAGGIQAVRLLNEGANRPIGAVLATGSVGLGVVGLLLIRRGIQFLRQDRAAVPRSDKMYRGKSLRVVWDTDRPAIRNQLGSSRR